jgi:hypothetical protein
MIRSKSFGDETHARGSGRVNRGRQPERQEMLYKKPDLTRALEEWITQRSVDAVKASTLINHLPAGNCRHHLAAKGTSKRGASEENRG